MGRRVRAAAAIALVGVVALPGAAAADPAAPAGSDETPALPTHVDAPGTWSDEEGPTGRLAALGLAFRSTPEGLFDETSRVSLFGVSAEDGRATWIRAPGVRTDLESLAGWFALSPDGRWIGWARRDHPRGPDQLEGRIRGWAVMDTTTGAVRRLEAPPARRLGDTLNDLAFSGDSRYLLASENTDGVRRTRGHRFVAYDVRSGRSTVLEEPGRYWLPSVGSAPSGVVWARGREVFRADPATGRRSVTELPEPVVDASWGPDDRAFAWIVRPVGDSDAPWELRVGRSVAQARAARPIVGLDVGRLLGWRDSRHVVVGDGSTNDARIVDVATGHVVRVDLGGAGGSINAPLLAEALWNEPLREPVDQTGRTDPRAPVRGGAAYALVGAGVGGLLVLRRRSARPDRLGP